MGPGGPRCDTLGAEDMSKMTSVLRKPLGLLCDLTGLFLVLCHMGQALFVPFLYVV